MYELQQLDLCCPDYFRGYSGMYAQVPVDENTTFLDVKLQLLNSQTYDWLFDYGDFTFDETKYIESVHNLFSNFTSLEYVPDMFYDIGSFDDDNDHEVYLYFAIVEL